jgi:hypothetical protein
MITTIESLKVRVADRYRVKEWNLSKDLLECVLRGDYRLFIHYRYVDNHRIEVTRWEKRK